MFTTGPLTTGQKTGIAGTAVQLISTSLKLNNGVYLQAPSGNSAAVTIGLVGVTAGTGFSLAAGTTSPLIEVLDLSTLYLISTGGPQTVNWIGS